MGLNSAPQHAVEVRRADAVAFEDDARGMRTQASERPAQARHRLSGMRPAWWIATSHLVISLKASQVTT